VDRLRSMRSARRAGRPKGRCPAFAVCLPAEALAKAGAWTAMRTATRRD
jgi:hypothetical protein